MSLTFDNSLGWARRNWTTWARRRYARLDLDNIQTLVEKETRINQFGNDDDGESWLAARLYYHISRYFWEAPHQLHRRTSRIILAVGGGGFRFTDSDSRSFEFPFPRSLNALFGFVHLGSSIAMRPPL